MLVCLFCLCLRHDIVMLVSVGTCFFFVFVLYVLIVFFVACGVLFACRVCVFGLCVMLFVCCVRVVHVLFVSCLLFGVPFCFVLFACPMLLVMCVLSGLVASFGLLALCVLFVLCVVIVLIVRLMFRFV